MFQILLFVFGLSVQTCLAVKAETIKRDYNTNGDVKKVTKRDYYAPEYNHEEYVSVYK